MQITWMRSSKASEVSSWRLGVVYAHLSVWACGACKQRCHKHLHAFGPQLADYMAEAGVGGGGVDVRVSVCVLYDLQERHRLDRLLDDGEGQRFGVLLCPREAPPSWGQCQPQ